DALAAEAPAPGGGSATGLVGALGAALVCMVANYTVGRLKYAAVEERVRGALEEAERLRRTLMRLTEEDEAAYEAVAAARRLPRKTDGEKAARRDAIQDATRAAATPPLDMAAAARRALELAGIVAEHGNHLLASDAGVAALFAEAALRASAINVRVNLATLDDTAFLRRIEGRLNELLDGTPALKEEILAVAGRRMVGG
ncbi:MAG TPA: cyclodeaminase/cyclohydrolase family protein, partial [Chloroflexota bacterium]|nr:cyclodeaminase/cyclohydrolase family protein [Chloroflexota bacterium]